ncbi:MAG: hypothetical protein HZA49_04790 [Planctomycetes bacterium]|nr:hypothetical protein [Planctomycetota bacterium]
MAGKRGSDWIPNKDSEFFTKQRIYVDRVDTNKVAWGIPDADIQVLKDLRAEYEPRYKQVCIKQNRTSAQVSAHRACRKRYEKAWRAFHKEWVLNNRRIPKSDLLTLVGREPDIKPTPKPKINDIPWVGLTPMGGGWIKVTCRRLTDEDSPSMHNDADVIECRYTFLPVHIKPVEGKKFFFPTPEECQYVQNSTRARFIIKCASEGVGMKFYGYFRWVNQRNPANNGSWTNGLQVVIA